MMHGCYCMEKLDVEDIEGLNVKVCKFLSHWFIMVV